MCNNVTYIYTYCEKHKVLLVVLPNTVVDPWTVVVHLPYTSFTHTVNPRVKLKICSGLSQHGTIFLSKASTNIHMLVKPKN